MKAVIIAGGEELTETLAKSIDEETYLICADKGLNYADKYNLEPDLIVGDMDSVDFHILCKYKTVEQVKFKPEKDFSDLELAINLAVEKNFNELDIYSAIGSRIDHSMSNIMLICKYADKNIKISLLANGCEIVFLNTCNVFDDIEYKYFSIIPVSKIVKGLSIENAKYELTDKNVCMGDTLCVSNEAKDGKLTIRKKDGNAILIFSNEL